MKENISARKGRDSKVSGPKTSSYRAGDSTRKAFAPRKPSSSSFTPSATSSYGSPRSSSAPAYGGSSSYSSSAPRRSGGSGYGNSSSYGGGFSGGSSYGGNRSAGSRSSFSPRTSSGGSSYGRPQSSGSSYGSPRQSSAPSYGGSSYGGGSYGGGRPGSFARPSFGGSSARRGGFSGGSRFGGRSGGARSGGSAGHMVSGFDIRKFVNKVDPDAVADASVPVYQNKHTFNDFAIAQEIKDKIGHKGFVTPSPIQDSAIPPILEGKDVVGIANTGTGKTAAFLIPLLNKVMLNPKEQVLILAPTRELAIQIEEELHIFTKGSKIYSVCCVGGAQIRRQISELRYFNNFIIGTPGRLKDLIDRRNINLSEFNTIVLDEADRMLDMGFIDDVRFMVSRMPKPRQTLFFTATLSKEIEKLIHEFLNDPVTISVKTGDTSKNVDQDVVRTASGKTKIETLHELLSGPEFTKVLVFGKTKNGVERLTEELADYGHEVGSIHGDKNHFERQRTLKRFKDNVINILVATDVAARGLDIPNVTHVINYELPSTYEDYVHRIGRTGRGGKHGKALTFIGR